MTQPIRQKKSLNKELGIDLMQTSRTRYNVDFVWNGDWFVLVGAEKCDCSAFRSLHPHIATAFREALLEFSALNRYANISIIRLVKTLRYALGQFPTSTFSLEWVAKALTIGSFISTKGIIDAFFIFWKSRFSEAISDDALRVLVKTRRNGARSSNVLSDDPQKSWLTEAEYSTLLHYVWNNYDLGAMGTQTTLIRLLSMQYARRPVQLASLKISDFRDDPKTDVGVTGRRICFPGAKDQQADGNFRNSKIEVHPIADHLWDLFEIRKSEVKSIFSRSCKSELTDSDISSLPLFTTLSQIRKAKETLLSHYGLDWQENLNHQLFHMSPYLMSTIIGWKHTRTPIDEGVTNRNLPSPLSHRTGKPMLVNANRMRHTRARQLARLGMPRHVLSFWLGHTHEGSIDAYYNDPAEDARKLNDVIGDALAPLALAFAGKLIDDRSQATRSNDPASILELAKDGDLKSVGACGNYSFCATTSIPIPCYRCKYFEPLVDAPHLEVLNALLARQAEEEKMIKIGGNKKMLLPLDLSADILAVRNCILRCNIRKSELEATDE